MNNEENLLKASIIPLLAKAWKIKWMIIPLGILLAIGTWSFTQKQIKIYQAVVQVIIDLEAPRYLPYNGSEVVSLGSGKAWNTKEFFETQYRIIRSRQVSMTVVKELRLKDDHDFLNAHLVEEEKRAEYLRAVDPTRVLQGRISLTPLADSHVVSIKVKDHNPLRAAKIANAVAQAYQKQNVGHKVSAAQEAVSWLTQKLSEMKSDRKTAEKALLAFKKEHDLLQSSLAERQNLLGLTIQSLEQQMIQSAQQLDRLKAEASVLNKANHLNAQMSVAQIINHPLIQRLKEQILSLENQKTSLLEQYLDQHPKVKTITLQIKRLTEAMSNEIKGIKQAFKNTLRTTQASHNLLRKKLEELKQQARTLQSQELSYQALETRVKSNQTLYSQMEVRLKEAELQAQATANNVRILDLALVPTRHISPRLSLNLVAAFVGWLLLSLILILILDYLDRTLQNQNQFVEWYKLVALGSIPMISRGKRPFKQDAVVRNSELYVLENPNSTVSECIRTIRTNLLFMNPNRSLNSLLVTSAAPREGKTLTCINLGIAMALGGERILIIDSDLRRPRVHKVFGLINDRGFVNMLVDPNVEPEEVIRPTELDSLDLLCSGPLLPNPSELLQSPAFKRTLDRLLQDYDRVIFDSPPVVPVTDAQILGRQVDGAVLVARAEQTHKDVFGRAVELLNNVQVDILGALLNGIDVSQEIYGHYYYQYKQEQSEQAPIEKRFGR